MLGSACPSSAPLLAQRPAGLVQQPDQGHGLPGKAQQAQQQDCIQSRRAVEACAALCFDCGEDEGGRQRGSCQEVGDEGVLQPRTPCSLGSGLSAAVRGGAKSGCHRCTGLGETPDRVCAGTWRVACMPGSCAGNAGGSWTPAAHLHGVDPGHAGAVGQGQLVVAAPAAEQTADDKGPGCKGAGIPPSRCVMRVVAWLG